MSGFVAVFDACVLYPAPLRDLLMRLAVSNTFRARWTRQIHAEWMGAVLKNRSDISVEQLERTCMLMNDAVPDCLITGYEGIEKGLVLPDPKDRHVLAAAILCQAGTIVTYNLRDFPDEILSLYGMTAQHPDQFIEHVFDLNPNAVIKAVRDQRASLKNPTQTVEELFDTFLKQGLATTVSNLRDSVDLL